MPTLSLSVIEVVILMLGAITLGITIHFFIVSRKSLKDVTSDVTGKLNKELEVWKLKYFNDTEIRDQELETLRKKLADAEENADIFSIEAEELRIVNKRLQADIENLKNGGIVTTDTADTDALQEQIEVLELANHKLKTELDALRKQSPIAADNNDLKELQVANRQLQAEIENLRRQLAAPAEDPEELTQLRIVNKQLRSEIEKLRHSLAEAAIQPSATASGKQSDYIDELRIAQQNLLAHNEKINQILGQIDMVKETEEKQQEIIRINEELQAQIKELRTKLNLKEEEINTIRQKEHLTTEMNAMLDSAYSEFNVLQSKMQKLEQQVAGSRKLSLEYNELREAHEKISHEYEALKNKLAAYSDENRILKQELVSAQEQFRDVEFQRQQLQKRVVYLEELNNDMQVMVDANKKLESQLKRIGELESMLNVIAEERDKLKDRKSGL